MKIDIGEYKIIREYTPAQKSVIMDALSLANPAYASAMKFTSYSRISIPMYLNYYEKMKDALVVPRGYKIPFDHIIEDDTRFTLGNVEYPKFILKLRTTQKEAYNAYIKGRENGDGVIVLPTGKGKSILGLFIASELKQKALIIVHKDDLVDGWKKDAKLALGLRPRQVGIIKAKEFRIGKQITITTIQTLSKLPPATICELKKEFSMIIVDECHHTPARTFEVASIFPAYDRIGLTATDMRNDGLGEVINFYLGGVCFRFEESDNDEDIISPSNVFINIKETKVDYSPPAEYTLPNRSNAIEYFYYDGESYQIDQMNYEEIEWFINAKVIKRKPLNYTKVMKAIWMNEDFTLQVTSDIIREYKKGKSSLILCIEKEHCRLIQDVLISAGIPEDKIQLFYESMDTSAMKRKAESKECLITIATYMKAKEGTNVKVWERVFLAMTINNELDTIQAIGRGRRKCEGKEELIVYDYSHPNVKGARNHIETRKRVYKERGFIVKDPSPKTVNYGMTRGFKSRSK